MNDVRNTVYSKFIRPQALPVADPVRVDGNPGGFPAPLSKKPVHDDVSSCCTSRTNVRLRWYLHRSFAGPPLQAIARCAPAAQTLQTDYRPLMRHRDARANTPQPVHLAGQKQTGRLSEQYLSYPSWAGGLSEAANCRYKFTVHLLSDTEGTRTECPRFTV